MASSVISRYKIQQNWDSDLKSLHASKRRNHALAFSGGADSVAALSVMPGSTIPIFLSRPNSEDSMYDSDAALMICKELSDLGYDVKIVDSNLEMISIQSVSRLTLPMRFLRCYCLKRLK